jgi:hypothetical protein
LAKHKALKILHIGHIAHGDTQCDLDLVEYPPKGMFVEGLFKNPNNFAALTRLYLE